MGCSDSVCLMMFQIRHWPEIQKLGAQLGPKDPLLISLTWLLAALSSSLAVYSITLQHIYLRVHLKLISNDLISGHRAPVLVTCFLTLHRQMVGLEFTLV